MRLWILAASYLAVALPASAQAPPQRIRGTIVSVAGDSLVVHSNGGDDLTVQLAADTTIRSDTPTTLAAIKPGTTLAIVSRGPADRQEAVGVRAMAPGITIRMGVSSWDLMPESTMTNAVVQGESVATSGKAMTLKAGDHTVQMGFAPDAVIALEDNADRIILAAGEKIMVFAVPGTGSALSARVVIVGLHGIAPPV